MQIATLEEQIRTSLGAWLRDRDDAGAYRTLRDGLSGIVALADSRADATVGGVADGVGQMLDRLGREAGELPEQALATLRQSIEALASWCARSAQADAAADSVAVAAPAHGEMHRVVMDAIGHLKALRAGTHHAHAASPASLAASATALGEWAHGLGLDCVAGACAALAARVFAAGDGSEAPAGEDDVELGAFCRLLARSLDALLHDGRLDPELEAAFVELSAELRCEHGDGVATPPVIRAPAPDAPGALPPESPPEAEAPAAGARGPALVLAPALASSLAPSSTQKFSMALPRLQRWLARAAEEQDLEVRLEMRGDDADVDRRLLSHARPVIEHLLHHALACIEPSERRDAGGKAREGRIGLACRHDAGHTVLTCSHDGAAIDATSIRTRAIKAGLIATHTPVNGARLLQLMVAPGLARAGEAPQSPTAVAALQAAALGADALGAELGAVLTADGVAAIEVTLASPAPVLSALLVRLGAHTVALPARCVRGIVSPLGEQIPGSELRDRSGFLHEGRLYPLVDLAGMLGVRASGERAEKHRVLLLGRESIEVVIGVDEVVGSRDVSLFPLRAPVAHMTGLLSAAAVLDEDRVALVADVDALWPQDDPAADVPSVDAPATTVAMEAPQTAVIMVVDDSLTVRKVTERTLLKHRMNVVVANDGIDAIEKLRDTTPDVMLVDIEMPRMDGFELLQRIRCDARSRAIPIIVITSRAGVRLRQKAMQLGAEAFLTKPYAEEDLITTVRQMLVASALARGRPLAATT